MIKHVEIENVKGFTLRGYLDLPENAKKIVVFFHGFTGNKTEHNGHFRNLSRLLSNEGVASLRMDYHGNGESDGEFTDFDFNDALDDAKRMIEYARSIQGIESVELVGFSFGGAVASMVATDNNCDKLLLISAAGNMNEIARHTFDSATKLENGNAYFSGFEMSENFVKSIETKDLYQNTSKFDKHILVIHGTKDTSVPYLYGVKYAVSYYNSQLYLIDDATHGYETFEQREKLYKKAIEFLK